MRKGDSGNVPVGEGVGKRDWKAQEQRMPYSTGLECVPPRLSSMGKPRDSEEHASVFFHQKSKEARFMLSTFMCYGLSHIPETINSLALLV